MATIAEIEKLALDLPDSDRAVLASHLLRSLPVLHDEDEGVAEALRRDAELDVDPDASITLAQLDQSIKDRCGLSCTARFMLEVADLVFAQPSRALAVRSATDKLST